MTEYFYPTMGILSLGILWLNTLLIAAAAIGERSRLGARLKGLVALGIRTGTVVSGDGDGGTFLSRTVHQVGRAMTVAGPDRILFTEERSEVDLWGGELELSGERLVVSRADPGAAPQTWLVSPAGERVETDFEAAFRRASTNNGLRSSVRQTLKQGDRVWYVPRELISDVDPSAVIGTKRAMLLLFALVSVLICGAITALIFVPPLFGTVSTIGGALALLYFLLVQPAGVKVRNWARLPQRQVRSDLWQRPTS